MKQELIKTTRKLGSSAGVLLPKALLGARVKVTVLEEPIKPLEETIRVLGKEGLLGRVLGIYLVGSYAREEAGLKSDVDILVITSGVTRLIQEGKYSFNLVSEAELRKSLKENPIHYLPMILEAKTLLNESLILKYKRVRVSRAGTLRLMKDVEKALKKARKLIDLDKALGNKNTGDVVSYSLVLRLKSLLIMEAILKKKAWSNKKIRSLVEGRLYERYLYVKNNVGKDKNKTPIIEAEALISLIEKWLKEKSAWKNK